MDPVTIGLIGAGLFGTGIGLGQQGWSQAFNSNEALKGRQFSGEQAALDRAFNAQQAQIARDWSKSMASTAYQRSVADMKQAGLNPALMAGGAGSAAAPGGVALSAGGSTSSPTAYANAVPNAGIPLSSAINSAIASTIRQNPHEFAANVSDHIGRAERLQNNSYNSASKATQKDVDDLIKQLDAEDKADSARLQAAIKKEYPWKFKKD